MKGVACVFVALVVASFVAAEPFNCTAIITESGGKYQYNLTSLYHDVQFSDSLYYMSSTGDLTYINLCGDTTTVCSPASPVCKRSGLWSTMGFGDLETQNIKQLELSGYDRGNGVTVEYTKGEYCPGTSGSAAKLHIVCGTDEAVTSLSISSDGCTVTATIKSKAGCGVLVGGLSGGELFATIVLILLAVGIVLYIAIGMIVNWKVKGAQTVPEMIPHKDFWVSIPFLVRDGCKFIGHGCKKGDYLTL